MISKSEERCMKWLSLDDAIRASTNEEEKRQMQLQARILFEQIFRPEMA